MGNGMWWGLHRTRTRAPRPAHVPARPAVAVTAARYADERRAAPRRASWPCATDGAEASLSCCAPLGHPRRDARRVRANPACGPCRCGHLPAGCCWVVQVERQIAAANWPVARIASRGFLQPGKKMRKMVGKHSFARSSISKATCPGSRSRDFAMQP